ncbi:MAG TPA: acetyl-CoA C-acyltransferase, partial [Bacteroidia bacterium]|nr:acetyl-CoA C-acyltransferase [Bacteroidia bacterium]
NGALSSVSATKLGAAAIKGALDKIKLSPGEVQQAYMGCVLQGNLGQAPARQAAKFAGLPNETQCTTVNKVCASGLKSIVIGAQNIMLGDAEVVVAGGMENMSATPYYLDQARTGYRLGNGTIIDGLVKDGLTDVYHQNHMGNSAELCAKEYGITREAQDAYAIESYTRAAKAWKAGNFTEEVVPLTISTKKGDITVSEDEEYKQVNFEKIPQLKPVFDKAGTVTAANASTLNDGAAALILMSKEKAEKLGVKPIAKILGYADAEQAPEWFTTTPSKAIPAAVQKAGLKMSDIEYFEINEAFSVVSIANNKLMNLDPAKVNINGGAVAIGHPLGCSGARIVVTLLSVLKQQNAKYGAAGICNGGGGGSALVIERL